jgi:small-conductance mechanosensitive channel
VGNGETLGAFFYRYIQETAGELGQEHNYLVVQAAGTVFFISELRLALSFLILASFFIFGMLFLPRFPMRFLRRSPIPPGKGEFARERVVHAIAVVMLWLCLICMAAAVFFRIGVYPFLMPALVLSFAARSLRRPLLSGILLGSAAAWLGFLMGLAVLPG